MTDLVAWAADLLEQLGLAALGVAVLVPVVNDGPAARFVVLDPAAGIVIASLVERGEMVRVHRSFRLLIEPLDHIRLKTLCEMQQQWSTT